MVLIANEVMQEGLDLHRSCRRVVHHDLPWNPAQLEQRVGRVDRLGSHLMRDRERDSATMSPRRSRGTRRATGDRPWAHERHTTRLSSCPSVQPRHRAGRHPEAARERAELVERRRHGAAFQSTQDLDVEVHPLSNLVDVHAQCPTELLEERAEVDALATYLPAKPS